MDERAQFYLVSGLMIAALVTAGMWVVGYIFGYDKGEQEAEKDCNEHYEMNVKRQKAGLKAAHTKVKKNLVAAKQVIKGVIVRRRGREE